MFLARCLYPVSILLVQALCLQAYAVYMSVIIDSMPAAYVLFLTYLWSIQAKDRKSVAMFRSGVGVLLCWSRGRHRIFSTVFIYSIT